MTILNTASQPSGDRRGPNVPQICKELQALERLRVWNLKGRIKNENFARAAIANIDGYFSGMSEKERAAAWDKAGKTFSELMKLHKKGEPLPAQFSGIGPGLFAVQMFADAEDAYSKQMLKFAKQLPVVAWVEDENQRGFGLPNLAILVGEAGDLNNYPNPAKLWKRFGLAPIEKDGKSMMPSTWRGGKQGKLSAADWEAAGYSPRRRSIAYNVGEPLMKLNHSEYRHRYDEAKLAMLKAHPDRHKKNKPDEPNGHCHNHAMLLMTKLLVKNLWIAWRQFT